MLLNPPNTQILIILMCAQAGGFHLEPLTLDLLVCSETCTVMQCGPAGGEEPAELRNTTQMLTQANLIIPAVFLVFFF